MLRICFITDGGLELGLGHVQQSTTFARTLQSEAEIVFLTKSDDTILAKITASGFTAERLADDEAILRRLHTLDPDIVIFDKLDVAEELAKDIKESLNVRLVIFTNLTSANRYADIAVTPYVRLQNVDFVDPETMTRCFFGPKYWIMRPEFYLYGAQHKQHVGIPKRILLMFGGSDPANLTAAVLNELLAGPGDFAIDVILGTHFPHEVDVGKVLDRNDAKPASVNVFRDVSNVAEMMFHADLVIASPGLSAFEALRVGTPVIVVPHNATQRDEYSGFIRMIEKHQLTGLNHMIESRDFTFSDDLRIVGMEIGEGIAQLARVIMAMPTPHNT